MPTPDQRTTIENSIVSIQAAQAALTRASLASSDSLELGKIQSQYTYLDSLLTQLVHTRLVTDDAVFDQAAATIKQTADHLNDQATSIGNVVSDVAEGGRIAGYLTQAATFIAAL